MRAKQLNNSIYLKSDDFKMIFKLTQTTTLPVTVSIEDSMPEDGDEISPDDIVVFAVLDNLRQMAVDLMEESTT